MKGCDSLCFDLFPFLRFERDAGCWNLEAKRKTGYNHGNILLSESRVLLINPGLMVSEEIQLGGILRIIAYSPKQDLYSALALERSDKVLKY